MAELVVPTVCRFSILGTYATRAVANIIDMMIVPAGGVTRGTAIEHQASVIISAWVDEVLPDLANNYTATEIKWVDLNSEDGVVGSATTGTGSDFPASGSASGDAFPGNICARLNKLGVNVRGQRKGRIYLPGAVESWTTDAAPNTIQSANQATLTGNMNAFLAVINNVGGGSPDYESFMGVIHTTSTENPDPPPKRLVTFESFNTISGFLCDPTLGSQRRRLRS